MQHLYRTRSGRILPEAGGALTVANVGHKLGVRRPRISTPSPRHTSSGYASSMVAGTPYDLVTSSHAPIGAGPNSLMAGSYGDDRETVRLLAREVMPALAPRTVAVRKGGRPGGAIILTDSAITGVCDAEK